MKTQTITLGTFLLLSGLGLSSCSTLNVREIKALERIPFETVHIEPDVEPNDLRLDVVRQTEQQMVGNTLQTVEVPYDPLGLNLGNGLFYDLNENFSLRLDYLLDFADKKAFELKKITPATVGSGFTVYSLDNDTLTISRPPGKKIRYQYHRSGPQDSLSFMRKSNLKYTVVQRDSALVHRNKRRVTEGIYKRNDENFYLQRRRKKIDYRLTGDEIHLRDHYIVALTNQNKTLGIYRPTRKGKKLIRTIERSQDKFFVYNKRFMGNKLELSDNKLLIFRNKKLVTQYEIENPKKERFESSVP
ncbi:hypothetical protein [Salmonirosea aquatica]|uniref:Uncharacterized protein n=1 Tax=Salmonirosea aquatica TaxID=2654236 RepID=A0A7C9BFR7_9BACT|nr:hypothetical protein [Cytophagaceae bacterium SJW1-29]